MRQVGVRARGKSHYAGKLHRFCAGSQDERRGSLSIR